MNLPTSFNIEFGAFLTSPFPVLLNDMEWLSFLAVGIFCLFFLPAFIRTFLPRRRWRVKRSKKIYRQLKKLSTIDAQLDCVSRIDPYLFEEVVLTSFEKQGRKVKRNRRYSGDGGIDGLVWIKGKRHYVQSKLYTGYIKRGHLSDFDRLCQRRRVRGVFVYTGLLNQKHQQAFKHITIVPFEQLIENSR